MGSFNYYNEDLDIWKRNIAFIQQEKSQLKNTFTEILKLSADANTIRTAEHLQNRFLHNDEALNYLQEIVKEIDELITISTNEDTTILRQIKRACYKINSKIDIVEDDFLELEYDLQLFISENARNSGKIQLQD